MQFVQNHWVLIAVAVLAVIVILKVVKTVLKWVLAAAIVIGVLAYGGYNVDALKALGTQVTDAAKDEAVKAMAGEAKQATYTLNGDGTYTVKTPNLELKGVPNSDKVTVIFRGIHLGEWKMEGAVRELVTGAREASQ